MRKSTLTVMLLFICSIAISQSTPEKMNLSQGFVDSMHAQTREHLIIDTISNYYNQFDYKTLNQAQRDLIFIRNFQDTLFSYDFVDLFINHSDIILVEAYEVFQRIECRSTQAKIEDYRKFYQEYATYIDKGIVPDVLNEDSPGYNPNEGKKLDQIIFSLDAWITMLPREKVLSVHHYIVDNKAFLYNGQTNKNVFVKYELTEERYSLIPILDTSFSVFKFRDSSIAHLNTLQDTLHLLSSLLEFEGDTSTSFNLPGNYMTTNPNRADYMVPDDKNYSTITTEVEALFIFNRIIEHDSFYIAGYPRLQASRIGLLHQEKMFKRVDERMPEVYKFYRLWLQKCYMKQTLKVDSYPLMGSGYSWL
ncbi:MAG: hypothetical protein QNK23_07630 [Crocinitomicaceae bacterium]|nr:hypothetical protein [Crocinitomicaceae bacterium]